MSFFTQDMAWWALTGLVVCVVVWELIRIWGEVRKL